MDDLVRTKARARSAAERARWRWSMGGVAPLLGVALVLCALPRGELAVAAAVASLSVIAMLLGVYRRELGRGAARGIAIGSPVALAAAFATACAPSLGGWECGAPCLVVGVVSAFAIELLLPQGSRGQRGSVIGFAAITTFAACAPLGIGIAFAAAAVTAVGCAGAAALPLRGASPS